MPHRDIRRPTLDPLEDRSLCATIAVLGSGVAPVGPLAGHVSVGVDVSRPGQPGTIDHLGHDTGVASVVLRWDPSATILPVVIVDDDGLTSFALIASGIEAALAGGADVINISFASAPTPGVPPVPRHGLTGGFEGGLPTLGQALLDAERANVPVVLAAGNDFTNIDANSVYPAWYARLDPGIAVVAAVDDAGNLAPGSNYGPRTATIGAPGVAVPVTTPGGTTAWDGTSVAAPAVSAVLAEIHDLRPTEPADRAIADLAALAVGPAVPVRDHGSILVPPVAVPPLVPAPLARVIPRHHRGHHSHPHPG